MKKDTRIQELAIDAQILKDRPDLFPQDKKLQGSSDIVALPILKSNTLEWIEQARHTVGYVSRNMDLTPFWREVYEDNHPNIMLVCGRQTYKTTFCTDKLANMATSRPRSEVCLVEDNETHLSAVSKQRLRVETFLQNPMLRQFLRYDRGNIGEISLANDSTIYCVTDEGEYKKVEGKSLQVLMLDETQYQDVQFLEKAQYSLFQTKGRMYMLGIGGEAGSEYHKMWERTDQREWIYEDKFWREKLTFDGNGAITNTNDELKSFLAGSWKSQKPENTQFRGYHLPQTIFPSIPLTIDDATTRYNVNPEFSIEYQRRYKMSSIYSSHCMGEFYKAERRPITPEMVEACYVRYLDFLTIDEVREIKSIFGNEVRVVAGIDWGSGPAASLTVGSVMLHWRGSNRYQLVDHDPRPQEHGSDQVRHFAERYGKAGYNVDSCVADYGYGQDRVPMLQAGGRDSHDVKFAGLGKSVCKGIRWIGDETKPDLKFEQSTDEHGTQVGRLQVDRTTVIQNYVDFIGQYVAHPTRQSDESCKRPMFMIPYNKHAELILGRSLLDDLCAITRKDLDEIQDVSIEDPRQRTVKQFNHPKDVVVSHINCITAAAHYDSDKFRIGHIHRRR